MNIIYSSPNVTALRSGSWSVWSLSDGYVDLPASSLLDGSQPASFTAPKRDGSLRLSVNCFFLLSDNEDAVLVDCGAGSSWAASMGHLGAAFEEAGLSMGAVKTIAFTHAHNDHISGLVDDSRREVFRNVERLLISKDALPTFAADERLGEFTWRLTTFSTSEDICEGLSTLPLPGHAAGHTGYFLQTGEEALLICGDIVHVPDEQFSRPMLSWAFDEDPLTAQQTRRDVLERAADKGWWLAGAHMGRPGVGKVDRLAGAFHFSPPIV